jgi:hypothetical protein
MVVDIQALPQHVVYAGKKTWKKGGASGGKPLTNSRLVARIVAVSGG